MSENPQEDTYIKAMQKVLNDPETQRLLEKEPVETMENLGFKLDDQAREELSSGAAQPELGIAAVPAVVVRVATNGTRPVVSVVVRSSTFADTKGRAVELDAEVKREFKS